MHTQRPIGKRCKVCGEQVLRDRVENDDMGTLAKKYIETLVCKCPSEQGPTL